MEKPYRNRSKRTMRNIGSAGCEAAKFTRSTEDKAAVGLFRCATTDHSGIGRPLYNMPSMGLFDIVRYIYAFSYCHGRGLFTGYLVIFLIAY